MWTCDHKAHDKMAFLYLCPLGSLEQLAAECEWDQSGQCVVYDVPVQELQPELYLMVSLGR